MNPRIVCPKCGWEFPRKDFLRLRYMVKLLGFPYCPDCGTQCGELVAEPKYRVVQLDKDPK